MVLSRLTRITGPGIKTDTNWVGNNANFTGVTTSGTSFNIGVTTIHSNLIEAHNIVSTGVVTAISFSGDGSGLTGVANTDFVVGTAITMGTANFTGNVTIGGTLTYEDVTNIDSVGLITARNGLIVTGVTTFAGNVDINAQLDVSGQASLSGFTTTTSYGLTTRDLYTTGITTVLKSFRVEGREADNLGLMPFVVKHGGYQGIQTSLFTASLNNYPELVLENTWNGNWNTSGPWKLKWTLPNEQELPAGDGRILSELQPTVTNSGLLNGFRLRATDNSTGLKNIFSLKPSQSSFYVTDSSGTTEAVRINTTGIGITHSLYHLGNTGVRLYFPGNNNIRFDTNSTERLRIDNTGIVSVFGDLDVDGHTNLDNVSIAGVTTTSGNVNVGGYVVSQGTSGRGGIFGQVEVGYDGTYLTVQPASGYNDLHLNYDNGSTVQIGHNSATTLTVNGNIVPKTDSARDLGLTGTRFRAAYVDTYYGDGSNLTGISGVTINNNADNRVITGSGTANTLEGEANLTFNGQKVLLINTAGSSPSDRGFQVEASSNLSDGDFLPALNFNPNASNTHRTRAAICGVSHNGTSGMHLAFLTRHAADGTQLSTSDEKVRITTDGKLGVGIDTPTEIFHIKKNDTTGPTITLENNANKAYINNWGSAGGGSGRTNRFEINATSQAQASICAPYITFMTGGVGDGSEKVRIDSVGRVMIGTTTEGNGNADEFTISYINHAGVSGGDQGRCGMTIRSGDNTSGVTQNGYIYFSDGTSGANESMGVVAYEHSTDSMYFSTAQVERLRATSSGITVTGTVDSASDVILKENIKTIDNALDKVTKLRGVEYDYKENKRHSIGVIAQEVEEVLPELVNGSEQKSVAYGNIAAVLIEAIKEQNEIINKMKKEIEDLKG